MRALTVIKSGLTAGVSALALSAAVQAQTCSFEPDAEAGADNVTCTSGLDYAIFYIPGFHDVTLEAGFDSRGLVFIDNSGVLTVRGTTDTNGSIGTSAILIRAGIDFEAFVHEGVLTSDDMHGVELEAGVTVGEFVNTGSITSFDPDASAIYLAGTVSGDFRNSGLIDSAGTGVHILGTVGGDFINDATGVITTDNTDYLVGFGLVVDSGAGIGGDLINRGLIYGAEGGVFLRTTTPLGGDFVNYGAIVGDPDDFSYGVVFLAGVDGNFYNSGDIIGGYGGVLAIGGVAGEVVNSGTILSMTDDALVMTDIQGNFSNELGGVIAGAWDGAQLQNYLGEFVFNAGEIYGGTGNGLSVWNFAPHELTLFNGATGTIYGGYRGLYVYPDGDLHVLNAGHIYGNQNGAYAASEGTVRFENTYSGFVGADVDEDSSIGLRIQGTNTLVSNFGVIEGGRGIVGDTGSDSVVNAGLITGGSGVAVSLGDGDDMFAMSDGGQVDGDILGGDGHDTFIVQGSWTGTAGIAEFEEGVVGVAGSLTLARDDWAFDIFTNLGTTDLAGHTLLAQDTLNLGFLLGGQGILDGNLDNQALVDVDGLHVTGQLVNSGALRFDVTGLLVDSMTVAGSATLGGQILINGDWSELARARQGVTLLTAGGGVSGSPVLNAATGVLFTPYLSLGATTLDLNFLTENFDTALGASTYNQTQAALGLQSRWNAGASAVDDLILSLNAGASSAPVLAAYSAEETAAITRSAARQGSQLARLVSDCAIGRLGAACDSSEERGRISTWTAYTSGSADLESDGNAAAVEESVSVLAQGLNFALNDRLSLGGFLAGGRSQVRVGAGLGSGNSQSLGAGVYGRAKLGGFTVAMTAGYSDLDLETLRPVPGGFSEGETGGSVTFAELDVRAEHVVGPHVVGLDASGRYAYSEMDAHTQSGGGLFDLAVQTDGFRSQTWSLDAFYEHRSERGASGHAWLYGASGGVLTGRGEDAASATAMVPGATHPFDVRGPASDVDDLGVHAGGFVGLESQGRQLTIRLALDAFQLGSETSQQATARLGWRF
ncbi:autotransporter outer membrane beta-barrel domain-containing protein [Maricaulis parjimensis]|uniref:autotransporter outer membrane beta-barrel domain-containing protein n=1 Tax=Maricaulis parjimensis TaxID=144023 RepID=UPI00193A23FB|nr:autotransporter outer membrane beta-barrel domain-containing protein [Maricaulis parjimensis]